MNAARIASLAAILSLVAPSLCLKVVADDEEATRVITVTDPGMDCEIHLLPKAIRIAVPAANNDLSTARGMSAPRLLRRISGDFVVQVKVTADFKPGAASTGPGPPYNGAGILIWQNANNFCLRLERSAALSNETLLCYPPLIEYWRNGAYQGFNNAAKRVEDFFQGRSTWLKVARRGAKLSISISHDGEKWEDVKSVPVEFPEELFVGVAALNTSNEPFTVEFEGLTINGKDAFLQPAVEPSMAPDAIELARRKGPVKDHVKHAGRDEPFPAVQYKVFKLIHQDAASIVKIVSQVVPKTERTTLRVVPQTRRNSVVASGSAQELAALGEVLSHLDQPGQPAAGSHD